MVPQKVKHRLTIWPCNSTPKYIPKGTENKYSKKHTYTHVHFCFIHNSQPKCPRVKEPVNKMHYSRTMEEYLATKSRKALIHATTEIKKVETKARIVWFYLCGISRTDKSTDRAQAGGCQGLWGGGIQRDGWMVRGFTSEWWKCLGTREECGCIYHERSNWH